LYSFPATLEATSTLNPGYHVLAISKSFIFLRHLHLSLFKYMHKFLIYELHIHVTVRRNGFLFLNSQPHALIVQIYCVVCRMYIRKLLMLGRENARNIQEFYDGINLDN
jgi:hypothetical protein